MIISSSLLFNCWEFSTRHPGILLVLLGVAGEVIFDWKEMKRRLAWAKRLSALVLIAGLILEFSEAAKSDTEVSAAIERAGNAEKEAGQANEGAANTESNNLVLQTKVLQLEASVSDRTITPEQVTNFIFLTEKVPKIPIKIDIGNGVGETESFAAQVRNMLNAAGFKIPSDANVVGLNTNPNFEIGRKIGDYKLASIDFLICTGTTNNVFNFSGITTEETNGFTRPIISENHTNNVYKAIEFSISQLKISTEWHFNFLPANPGECEIFIPQKSN